MHMSCHHCALQGVELLIQGPAPASVDGDADRKIQGAKLVNRLVTDASPRRLKEFGAYLASLSDPGGSIRC